MEHQNLYKKKICDPCDNCYKLGCRCLGCGEANNVASRNASRRRRRPDSGWDNPRVSPGPAIAHLAMLKEHGMGACRVAVLLGRDRFLMTEIANGNTKFIMKNTERDILGITVDSDPDWISGKLLRERLIWLGSMGVSTKDVADIAGMSHAYLKRVRSKQVTRVNRERASKIMRISPNSMQRKKQVATTVRKLYVTEAA